MFNEIKMTNKNKKFKMEEFIFEILRKIPDPYFSFIRIIILSLLCSVWAVVASKIFDFMRYIDTNLTNYK